MAGDIAARLRNDGGIYKILCYALSSSKKRSAEPCVSLGRCEYISAMGRRAAA